MCVRMATQCAYGSQPVAQGVCWGVRKQQHLAGAKPHMAKGSARAAALRALHACVCMQGGGWVRAPIRIDEPTRALHARLLPPPLPPP